jgi:hypothetical protein
VLCSVHLLFTQSRITIYLDLKLNSQSKKILYKYHSEVYIFLMTLTNRNDLSIVEVVFYAPILFLSILLCARHGFEAWIAVLIFTLIRLAGASLELATIKHPTIGIISSAVMLSSIGLSPLLLATLGLIMKVRESIDKEYHLRIRHIHLRVLRILILLGFALILIGMEIATHDYIVNGTFPINVTTKIGLVLLITIYAVLLLLTSFFFMKRSHAEPPERRLVKAIACSLPFILVRLIYAVLVIFSKVPAFNIFEARTVAYGLMAIFPEMVVVLLYVGVGMTLPRKTTQQGGGKHVEMVDTANRESI